MWRAFSAALSHSSRAGGLVVGVSEQLSLQPMALWPGGWMPAPLVLGASACLPYGEAAHPWGSSGCHPLSQHWASILQVGIMSTAGRLGLWATGSGSGCPRPWGFPPWRVLPLTGISMKPFSAFAFPSGRVIYCPLPHPSSPAPAPQSLTGIYISNAM